MIEFKTIEKLKLNSIKLLNQFKMIIFGIKKMIRAKKKHF